MWNLVSFVKRAKVRKAVLEILAHSASTPGELAKATKLHRPSISRAINDLEKKGLVVCLTPKERLGRIYKATEKGKQILKM